MGTGCWLALAAVEVILMTWRHVRYFGTLSPIILRKKMGLSMQSIGPAHPMRVLVIGVGERNCVLIYEPHKCNRFVE